MTMVNKPNNKSAARTLDVIEFIVNSVKAPTFGRIREELDIPKSSLSYLLQDLIDRDYIFTDPDMKVYYPGIKLIQLGAVCINNIDISREIALGVRKLSDELGCTAHAAILDGRFIVYIAKCQSTMDLSVVTNIGFRVPAHATALGKVLLAALGQKEWRTRLYNVQLERYTENTITSYGELLEELSNTAAQGYGIDNQEIIPGGICVAAPVFDRTGRIVAAISATVPVAPQGDDIYKGLISKVLNQATGISMRLGNY